jgi:hypothetical protein
VPEPLKKETFEGEKNPPKKTTGDGELIRVGAGVGAAAGAGGAGPIPNGQRHVKGDALRKVFSEMWTRGGDSSRFGWAVSYCAWQTAECVHFC